MFKMIFTQLPVKTDTVVWMRNPFKYPNGTYFSSENKSVVNKRCNELADFIEKNENIFKAVSLCNIDSIGKLRSSDMDGNISKIGFTKFPGAGFIAFLGFWVHPDMFSDNDIEVDSLDEFMKIANEWANSD